MSGRNESSDSNSESRHSEESDTIGRVLDGAKSGILRQTRFTTMSPSQLPPTRDTVFGINDMNLGKIVNGQPSGRPIIRFDKGMKDGNPHINIDPKGFSSSKNPHISVSESTIGFAKTANTILKAAGVTLTVAAAVYDIWRFGKAIADDVETRENAPKIIAELKEAIAKLKKQLEVENNPEQRKKIKQTIEELKAILKDVERIQKNVPVKAIKQGSSIIGGWGLGAAGGAAGAWAGAASGAAIGSIFGPVGTVVGGPIGAVAGAIGLGIGGGLAGSAAGEYVADKGMEYIVD